MNLRRYFEDLSASLGRPVRLYVACPYTTHGTGHNKRWELIRFELANIAAMRLVKMGCIVFSPISMSHPMSLTQPAVENTHKLWLRQDFEFLDWCDVMIILTLPGWVESFGVNEEHRRCFRQRKVCIKLSIDDIFELEREEINEKRARSEKN